MEGRILDMPLEPRDSTVKDHLLHPAYPVHTWNADVMDGPRPATTPRPPDASFPCAHRIPVAGSRP